MRLLLISILLASYGCATKPKDCWSQAWELQSNAEKKSELVLFQGAAGRSKEDAIWLMQRSMPVYHQEGKRISVDRTRKSDSNENYDETNYAGFWSLRNGEKSPAILICQDNKHGNYHAFGLVNIQQIENYLIGE